MTWIVAHRGNSSEAPENTLLAFQQAIDLGADCIELDVHLSHDWIPVVFHDAEIDQIRIKELSLSQLKALRIADEAIPTLQEVFELDFKRTKLFIELKGDDVTRENVEKFVSIILSTVKFPVIMGSFSNIIVQEVKRQRPDQLVFGITDDERSLLEFVAEGIQHLSIWEKIITPELMNTLRGRGVEVWSFTVNDVVRARQLIEMGVVGIITDVPRLMIRR